MADTLAILPSITPMLMGLLKMVGVVLLGAIIIIVGVVIVINARRRKWKIEVHEQKADGRIHTVGFDRLVERKLKNGTKTIYWLKKARCETIPPPDLTVDRYKNKEEVDYLRIERDYIPCSKYMNTNYSSLRVRKIITTIHDDILNKIHDTKTTFFDSEPVRQKYIYIPIEKALTAKMNYRPIDFDMSMMAMNEIHNADEFYQTKMEWWKKWGAIIMFAATIVFLIILVVLTFGYITDVVKAIMGQVDKSSGLLQDVVNRMAGGKPPS